jgi:hypothetical protein
MVPDQVIYMENKMSSLQYQLDSSQPLLPCNASGDSELQCSVLGTVAVVQKFEQFKRARMPLDALDQKMRLITTPPGLLKPTQTLSMIKFIPLVHAHLDL